MHKLNDPMRPCWGTLVEARRDEALRERMVSAKLAEYQLDDETLDYLSVIEEIEGDLL